MLRGNRAGRAASYHIPPNFCYAGSEDPPMANTVLSDIPLISVAQNGRKAAVQAANTLGNLIQAGGKLPIFFQEAPKVLFKEKVFPCAPEAGKKLEEESLLRCINSSPKSGYAETDEEAPYPVVGTSS